MNPRQQREITTCVDLFRRGIVTASDMGRILLTSLDADDISTSLNMLPEELRTAVINALPEMPTSEDAWVNYEGLAQADGDEQTWAAMVMECRAITEALRAFVSGAMSPSFSEDFDIRLREAYLVKLRAEGK